MLGGQVRERKGNMPKVNGQKSDEMLAEYDFSGGIRGKYAKRYREGTNVVVLEPDVAKAFPTARAVNQALRSLAKKATKTG